MELLLFLLTVAGCWTQALSSTEAETRHKLTNITIYRLTPINYTGVTNMDTGDAAGDVMFGLNQLLLPQLCPQEPSFTWCANRQYLSGGSAKMVYTEFVVEADDRFGEYNACNPDKKTGIFQCQTYTQDIPEKCATGFDIFHEDCLNGTLLHSFSTAATLYQAEASCCAACSAATNCGGWNLMPGDTWTCQILANDRNLTVWDFAQSSVGCKAAQVDPSAYACWYTNPLYNVTFAGVCDPKRCTCDAVSKDSVGREENAMCWNHSQSQATEFGLPAGGWHHSKWFNFIGELGCLLDGTWYSTQTGGECKGSVVDDTCWWRLAETHRTINSTCVDDRVVSAVQHRDPECWQACPQPGNRTTGCFLQCLFETILGSPVRAIKPMVRAEVVAPFVSAFRPEAQGGCPDVVS